MNTFPPAVSQRNRRKPLVNWRIVLPSIALGIFLGGWIVLFLPAIFQR